MNKWHIYKGTGKLKGQEIDIWNVAPEPYKYGFASFTDEKAALIYLKKVNEEQK